MTIEEIEALRAEVDAKLAKEKRPVFELDPVPAPTGINDEVRTFVGSKSIKTDTIGKKDDSVYRASYLAARGFEVGKCYIKGESKNEL